MLDKYADLIVRTGANVHEGDLVVVNSDINSADFARRVQEAAYRAGAFRVFVYWRDELSSRITYTYETTELLTDIPGWVAESRNIIADKHMVYICLLSEDPDIYSDIPAEKVTAASRAAHRAYKRFYDASMTNDIRWCLAAMPTEAWGRKVFPEMAPGDAKNALWQLIASAMRLDAPDPVKAWKEHLSTLAARAERLNSLNLTQLHYTNSLGTDLVIGLPRGYRFVSGGEVASDGYEFIANMPTEEIFSAPDCRRAEGRVVASMPLIHNGSTVEDFELTFKDGRVTDYSARIGEDVLRGILETDEGSRSLGEVALVPYDSPISNMHTLFYETLFDENASCHLALGKAYASCVEGGDAMDDGARKAAGINSSAEHVDFMIGTKDLSIVGTNADGRAVVIFKDGNFVF